MSQPTVGGAPPSGSSGMPTFDPSSLGGGAAAKDPVVYWGSFANKNASGRDRQEMGPVPDQRPIGGTTTDHQVTMDQAMQDFYGWTDQERASWGKRLTSLGVLKDPTDFTGMVGAWQDAVKAAANFYTYAGRRVTPWQAVDLMVGNHKAGATTHTETNFSVPTVEDAHAATKQIFQSLMGRGPDENELNRYASMMTAYAQKHPKVTKTVTDAQGNSTVTNSGGVSDAALGDVLSNQAKQDPEYGAYQAATTYWNALMQAVGTSDHG